VKKHEIARSVLCRLNDAGEPALAFRREVIKRISEFDDFSVVGITIVIRHRDSWLRFRSVNVKDSFTRIHLERERERKDRQGGIRRKRSSKQEAAKKRAAIKDSLYKLFGETDPYKRGKAT